MAKDSPLDVLRDFAPWLLVVAPLAAVALAAALLWAVPLVIVGGIAWVIWTVTLPRCSHLDTRPWRAAGGTGYAPRRLHPQDSCAGEAD